MWFYLTVLWPKDADGMANSVDPDQTLIWVQTLPRPVCPKTQDHDSTWASLFPFMAAIQQNYSWKTIDFGVAIILVTRTNRNKHNDFQHVMGGFYLFIKRLLSIDEMITGIKQQFNRKQNNRKTNQVKDIRVLKTALVCGCMAPQTELAVQFLKYQTLQKIAVITLKFEQGGLTIE